MALPAVPLDRYKLLRIIQAMDDPVLVFTPEGTVLLCNPSFERIFYRTQSTLAGKPLSHVFAVFAPELAQIIPKRIDARESGTVEITLTHTHPHRTYVLTTLPIEENGELTEGVAVFHDITDQKQTEKMRRDFVANVSHELRTPLSAIHGYAETLLEGALKDEAVARDFVQIILNHSHRLSLLVQDLLDLSKLEASDTPFELVPLDLSVLVDKVVRLYQKPFSKKQIAFSQEIPENLLPVLAHDRSLEQVLTNLLDNALKYTPEAGNIKLSARLVNDLVQVDVADTGIGIEAKHIPRLFERFYRVDKARSRDLGGTGLGLAIVKHLIQCHGGEVWVTSEPGQGTTFSFTLKPFAEI